MGIGSLAGAILILEPARKMLKPNQMTLLGSIVLVVSYLLMALVRQPEFFLAVAALAGAAWTISASELWVAGQRVIPDWIRGRMNATHMMVSQGGLSIAGIVWGALATKMGVEWALLSASGLGIASAITAKRWSIDFSARMDLEPHPLETDVDSPYLPEPEDGPVTSTLEIEIAPENHLRFFRIMKEIRMIFLRNGAFSARLDQDMSNPNRFRLQATTSSWAAHQLVGRRITRDEHALWSELWTLHLGKEVPVPRKYLGIQHWIPEASAVVRLKPAMARLAPDS
jgi:MFS family permease